MQARSFPNHRARRLRKHDWIRSLTSEYRLHTSDLILPVFVHAQPKSTPIDSMPGVMRLSLDDLVRTAQQACDCGIKALMLFPVVCASKKDALGHEALREDNITCRALKRLKQANIPIGIVSDIALDPYTTHGHDGVLDNHGDVDNDATVALLAQQALLHAQCGADMVAPSDMQDGRVGAIRHILEQHDYPYVGILSYTAKYASSFYTPFRDAVDAKGLGHTGEDVYWRRDKKTYQMPVANANDAVDAAATQLQEGADMLIVKPAMYYLDIMYRLKQSVSAPVVAYQVSGEYSMLHALARNSHTDAIALFCEGILACKRAGAQAVISYAAMDVARAISS